MGSDANPLGQAAADGAVTIGTPTRAMAMAARIHLARDFRPSSFPAGTPLFVLQLNADAPEGEKQTVIDAAKFIAEQTKISAPS